MLEAALPSPMHCAVMCVVPLPMLLAVNRPRGGETGSALSEMLPWLILLVVLVLVGGVVIYLMRRAITDSGSVREESFSLQALREMRAQGQITDDEFERARAALIGRLTGAASEAGGDEPAQSPSPADQPPADDAPRDARASGNEDDGKKAS